MAKHEWRMVEHKEIRVTFTIRATFACENCGHRKVLEDNIYCSTSSGEEVTWVLAGEKASGSCELCDDTMRMLPLRSDTVLDLTTYQEVED